MRSRTVRLLVLSSVFLLGGGTLLAPPNPAQARPIKIVVGHRNNPVTPVLDSSRSSTATLGPPGGTLSTTAADGSSLQLTLPPNALAGTEPVTITPLQRVVGTHMRFVAGVQIAPAGLRLLKPAQLSIRPAYSVRRSRAVAFGYQGSGIQFGLVPLALTSKTQIPLLWFGGLGLASATRGQLSGRAKAPPSDPAGAWLQQLSLPLYALRNHRAVQSTRQTITDLLAGYYDGYVKPLLRRPGSNLAAWRLAAARGLSWEREEQMLGYARRFSGDDRRLRTTVFEQALQKRWTAASAGCNPGTRTLGALQDALVLARTAQSLGAGSRIGGPGAIVAALQSCADLPLQATLNPTNVTWQTGLASNHISRAAVTAQTAGTPLLLQQPVGSNQFAFASPHAAVTERVNSWTLAPADAGRKCGTPSFLGFTTDPNQMYAAFTATLIVPADLFLGAQPPPAMVALAISGADLANWSMTCPGQTIPFSQPPGAMAGLGAVTAATPIVSNPTTSSTTAKFSGSADILAGTTITGYANSNGKLTVTVPR